MAGPRKNLTLTRVDIAERVGREIGMSRADAAAVVASVLRHVCGALSQGESVKIARFGSFRFVETPEKVVDNPKMHGKVCVASPEAAELRTERAHARGAGAAS